VKNVGLGEERAQNWQKHQNEFPNKKENPLMRTAPRLPSKKSVLNDFPFVRKEIVEPCRLALELRVAGGTEREREPSEREVERPKEG
jgi:hypothetical protein